MKNILITGSTDGIGKLAAMMLAKMGHSVFVHGRSEQKVNATIAEIKSSTNNNNIGGFVADFSNLKAVKQMAQEINEHMDHIDVLINNAGILKTPDLYNQDGLDLRFVVNYLAPYILTEAILPVIVKGTDSRIINLSSAAQSAISYDAMIGKKPISINESYAQSKLALTMWSFYLAKQLNNVVVIAVNPGSLLNTKMANQAYGQYWSPASKGANILCELTLSQEQHRETGKYFDNDCGEYANVHPHAYDEVEIDKLIDFTNKLIK